MDQTALFTLTYGVFILGANDGSKKNACIINTCTQLTSEPARISITVLKSNLTHDMIDKSNTFSISVLGKHASLDTIARFGFKSGRDTDKLEGIAYEIDSLSNPVIKQDSIAIMSCKVAQKIDLGSHTLFISDVLEAEKIDSHEPITYAYYRDLKAGKITRDEISKVEQEKVTGKEVYECSVCHYVYDGELPFEELPNDYVCPVCKKPKEVFSKNS